jgi:hypothetical protein
MSGYPPADPYYKVNFPYYGFDQFKLVKYPVPLDNNCFFHALMLAFDRNYRTETNPANRFNSVMAIRLYIANQLPSMYSKLSRGHLESYAEGVEEYKLANLYQIIKGRECVGLEAIELSSIILNINIAILDAKTLDVYRTGDYELLHRAGNSYVVLLYDQKRAHYELIGMQTDKGVVTYFNEGHTLIKHIKSRLYASHY